MKLVPAAEATREAAEGLAELADLLEREGHDREEVAAFLLRCVLTMIAEAMGLIGAGGIARSLGPEARRAALEDLWRSMRDEGGPSSVAAHLVRSSGDLFRRPRALPLSEESAARLLAMARRPWLAIEPAIFGTLLLRALDAGERHALGAHYTPPAYVARLVRWTVEDPLRADFAAAAAEARRLAETGERERAIALAIAFLRSLAATRILDPACGTGNFLYVALDSLMRLEGDARALVDELGGPVVAASTRAIAVTPAQLLGIEVKQRAKEIAELVLWIGYLQGKLRAEGRAPDRLPDARPSIENRDAVLSWDGGAPREAAWPDADFIIGNPPFVGSSRMRAALGDAYVEALRRAHRGVPDGSDLVMYWWSRAASMTRSGRTRRFGFITTNSVTQTLNRRVVKAHLDSGELSIVFAVPDHPWVDDQGGAAVRIAIMVAERRDGPSQGADGTLGRVVREPSNPGSYDVDLALLRGRIHADLTIGATAASAVRLRSNEGLASPGVKLHGAGFIVTEAEAAALGLGRVPGLARHIRPYRNGRDLTQAPRGVLVIDLDGLSEAEVKARYPDVHAWLSRRVKPARDQNSEAYRRDHWWLFGRRNTELRAALAGLCRYISTAETSKHRVFTFLDASILPDNMLVNIAVDDAYYLGVLSSRPHVVWALAAGGRLGLGNDPRYTKTRCFDPFPFPHCGEAERRRIRELGEALDGYRKQRLASQPGLTMTGLYNALERLRAGRDIAREGSSAIHPALVSALLRLHDELDAAVLGAYGLAGDLADDRLLEALVALNTERTAEELRGVVRWVRPDLPAGRRAA